jgi:RNA polymerase sigma-70 factor (ECF subfamily)
MPSHRLSRVEPVALEGTTDTAPSGDELMRRLQKGDMDALGVLYERYQDVVSGVVQLRGEGLSSSDVEDTCHEVFLTLLETAPRYRPGNSLKAWLCGIAVQKTRRLRDRTRRRGLLSRWFSRGAVAASEAPRALARIEAESVLARLPDYLQEVVVLSCVESLSSEEIGQALGISPKTVGNRLYKARLLAKGLRSEEDE